MAYQVIWLPGAIDDLDAIAAYIAAGSPAHAAAVVARMLASAAGLTAFPKPPFVFTHPACDHLPPHRSAYDPAA